jgi:hypothetical protein
LQTIDHHYTTARACRCGQDGGEGGNPARSLTSLRALIHPDVAEKVLDGYWRGDGEVPTTYTINLSSRFVALAHAIGGFDHDDLRRLEDARFALEQHRANEMTPKNLALIRCVLTNEVWSRVTQLPEHLIRQARLGRHAPVRAAVLAQIAVAVAILTIAPIRLGNLASIRLGENLIKPGGPQSNYFLTFNKYDVKNRVPLQFKLDDVVTAIINEYVHDFRPLSDARHQRGLALSRRGQPAQGKDLVQHPDRPTS